MRSRIALACAIALILVTDVAVVVRHRAGYGDLLGLLRQSTAEGRRELRALRREPILDYRAPGTRPRFSSDLPAGKDLWGADQPTEVRRTFVLDAEPGEAVDAYRVRAEASGWRLVEAQCSFGFRFTRVTMIKEVAGRPATLVVSGDLDPPGSLLVIFTGEAPARPPQDVIGSALRRHDVHCLRGFDPNGPTMQRSARQPQSGAEICGLLDPAEARRIMPTAFPAQAEGQGDFLGCRYGDTSRGGFLVRNTERPRAFYDDQRWIRDPGHPSYVLIGERTDVGPQGAWVDTRIGPVEIYGGGTEDNPGLDARQLTALAKLLLRGK
jgi:hypothetical protein